MCNNPNTEAINAVMKCVIKTRTSRINKSIKVRGTTTNQLSKTSIFKIRNLILPEKRVLKNTCKTTR